MTELSTACAYGTTHTNFVSRLAIFDVFGILRPILLMDTYNLVK